MTDSMQQSRAGYVRKKNPTHPAQQNIYIRHTKRLSYRLKYEKKYHKNKFYKRFYSYENIFISVNTLRCL